MSQATLELEELITTELVGDPIRSPPEADQASEPTRVFQEALDSRNRLVTRCASYVLLDAGALVFEESELRFSLPRSGGSRNQIRLENGGLHCRIAIARREWLRCHSLPRASPAQCKYPPPSLAHRPWCAGEFFFLSRLPRS